VGTPDEVRAMGILLGVGGAFLAAMGLLWAFLAVVGREWDYCPSGECYPGELVGGAIAVLGVTLALAGARVTRRR
jgi:hypothetical protein